MMMNLLPNRGYRPMQTGHHELGHDIRRMLPLKDVAMITI
jgi:hypothetical protein